MSSRNHALTYRPLQGGILIINPVNDRPGTVGAILADGADRFALSCYHVLCRADIGPFSEGEPVLQSLATKGGAQVGRIFAAHCDAALDVAAAKIDPGIEVSPGVLGLSALGQPLAPAVGMRLLKAGAFTGVTEGRLVRVDGDTVEIGRPIGYPAGYELCDFGDSGAIWVECDTSRPVALHRGQGQNGNAHAVRFETALEHLRMALLPH